MNLGGMLKGYVTAVQSDGAGGRAQAARAAGAGAVVHVSAIGADPHSRSRYGRTKGEGEARVLAAFPGATIIRPTVIFGPDDDFINSFARMANMLLVIPVVKPDARFQPVWVGDVREAVASAGHDPGHYGGNSIRTSGTQAWEDQ